MSNKKVKIDTANEVDETAEQIKEVEQVKDSPFSCVRVDDQYFLSLGKYRLTELSSDKEAILKEAENTSWERLLAIMYSVATEVYENAKSRSEALKMVQDEK